MKPCKVSTYVKFRREMTMEAHEKEYRSFVRSEGSISNNDR